MHQDTTDLHHYPSYLFLYTHEFQWQFSLNHLDLNDQMTKRKLQSIRKISNYFLSNKLFMPWSTNPVLTTNRSSKAKEYSTNIAYANQRICFLADLYFVLSLHLLRKKLAFSIVINNPLFVLSQFRLYRPQSFFLSAATHSYKRARFPSSVKRPAANCCQITVGPAASWDDPSWSKNCTWASVIATLSYTSPAFAYMGIPDAPADFSPSRLDDDSTELSPSPSLPFPQPPAMCTFTQVSANPMDTTGMQLSVWSKGCVLPTLGKHGLTCASAPCPGTALKESEDAVSEM